MSKFLQYCTKYDENLVNSVEWYDHPYVNYTFDPEYGAEVFYRKNYLFDYNLFKQLPVPHSRYRKIDLGLKDDQGRTIYFADRNVGALSPTDVGCLFMGGDTTGVINYKKTYKTIQEVWEESSLPSFGDSSIIDIINVLILQIDPTNEYLPPCDKTTFNMYYSELINTSYGTLLVQTGEVVDENLFTADWTKSTPSYEYYLKHWTESEFTYPSTDVYDPAVKYMRGKWVTPSIDIWGKLMTLDKEFVYDYKGTGKNGLLITGTNGNKLFFPCSFATSLQNDFSMDSYQGNFSKIYGGLNYFGKYNTSTCITNYGDSTFQYDIAKPYFGSSSLDGEKIGLTSDPIFALSPTRAVWIE